ncbi:MAG TPA: NADH-quinone oxidoreductase subunit N [Anaerolineales bacterium]|nr:NADH-quinone oxidoreductase subunit N [Anaerolineales bacterium]
MNLNLLAIFPELLLLILGVLLLVIDPFWKKENRRVNLGWYSAGGLFAVIILSVIFARPAGSESAFGGMIRYDGLAFVFKMLFIFAAGLTSLFFMDAERLQHRAEAYLLLIASTIGMSLMASATDLVMLYLAIETTSIPMYVLSGFLLDDDRSTEAGFKYLLFGALTSATFLYGLSLIYGFSGTTQLEAMDGFFGTFNPVSLGVLFLLVVGLGFKISLVPFHFWAPDVYQGAPTSVAGFLSTASKAAGFAVLIRILVIAFPQMAEDWQMLLAILAAISMTLGNLVALAQTNIKRLLAYSSIAHAGYALVGLVANNELGLNSVVYYLIAYMLTNLAAFAIIAAFGKATGSDEIRAYDGMSRRSPYLGLAMLVAFLSLSGMPPFGGFIGKVLVFAAAIQDGWYWLVFVGIINSIIGVYYYLTVLKYVYLYRMEGEVEKLNPIQLSRPFVLGLGITSLGIIVVGVIFSPWFGLAEFATKGLL